MVTEDDDTIDVLCGKSLSNIVKISVLNLLDKNLKWNFKDRISMAVENVWNTMDFVRGSH